MENKQLSLLVVSLGRHLTSLNRWQIDPKIEKDPLPSLGQDLSQINEQVPRSKKPSQLFCKLWVFKFVNKLDPYNSSSAICM